MVAYLTTGDPDVETARRIALAAIDDGADVIELGVPFSDPLADGPVIQRASERAVARHTRMADVLRVAKEIRAARPDAGLVIFTYLNPILRYGLTTVCGRRGGGGRGWRAGDGPDCGGGRRVPGGDGEARACAGISGSADESG